MLIHSDVMFAQLGLETNIQVQTNNEEIKKQDLYASSLVRSFICSSCGIVSMARFLNVEGVKIHIKS